MKNTNLKSSNSIYQTQSHKLGISSGRLDGNKYLYSGNITAKMPVLAKTSNRELSDILKSYSRKHVDSHNTSRNSLFTNRMGCAKNTLFKEILAIDNVRKTEPRLKNKRNVLNRNIYLVENYESQQRHLNHNVQEFKDSSMITETAANVYDQNFNIRKFKSKKVEEMKLECDALEGKIRLYKKELLEMEHCLLMMRNVQQNFQNEILRSKSKAENHYNQLESGDNNVELVMRNKSEQESDTNKSSNVSESTVVSSSIINGFSYKLTSNNSHDLISMSNETTVTNGLDNSKFKLHKQSGFFKRLWHNVKVNIKHKRASFQATHNKPIIVHHCQTQKDPSSQSHYFTATDNENT